MQLSQAMMEEQQQRGGVTFETSMSSREATIQQPAIDQSNIVSEEDEMQKAIAMSLEGKKG